MNEQQKIKTFLTTRNFNTIDTGIELIRSLENNQLFETLLKDIIIDQNGFIVRNKTFIGTGPAQPFLDYALWKIISIAPQNANIDKSIKIKNITHINMELSYHQKKDLPEKICKYFTNLKILILKNAKITDLNFLKNNKKLKTIFLEDCSDLKDISGIETFNLLNKLIIINAKKIKNIDGMAKNIKYLNLTNCDSISNLNGLLDCSKLEELELIGFSETIESNINSNSLKSFNGLKNCTELKKIVYTDNNSEPYYPGYPLKNIDAIKNCKKLKFVILNKCHSVENFDSILKLNNIKSLKICNNKIKNLNFLQNCLKLEVLDIKGCIKIDNVDCIADLKNLTNLNMTGIKDPHPINKWATGNGKEYTNKKDVEKYQIRIKLK